MALLFIIKYCVCETHKKLYLFCLKNLSKYSCNITDCYIQSMKHYKSNLVRLTLKVLSNEN
jgi:hypothetical protein